MQDYHERGKNVLIVWVALFQAKGTEQERSLRGTPGTEPSRPSSALCWPETGSALLSAASMSAGSGEGWLDTANCNLQWEVLSPEMRFFSSWQRGTQGYNCTIPFFTDPASELGIPKSQKICGRWCDSSPSPIVTPGVAHQRAASAIPGDF